MKFTLWESLESAIFVDMPGRVVYNGNKFQIKIREKTLGSTVDKWKLFGRREQGKILSILLAVKIGVKLFFCD